MTDGIYYCPVRDKSSDVDAALCRFCPATKPTERNKQEFIDSCHKFHNFNG